MMSDDGLNRSPIRVERRGWLHFRLRQDMSVDEVMAIIHAPSETLKRSRKSWTRRVDRWVIKESGFQHGLGAIKCTLTPWKHRRAWLAAHYLLEHGVLTPSPVALIETGCGGVIVRHQLMCEYLRGGRNVEHHAADLANNHSEAQVFLNRLADAVKGLCDAGVYHADLSGKNILTQDGRHFYFIDLDSVRVRKPYTDALRMKNHVQLYDSFCDVFSEDLLNPFLVRMLPGNINAARWLEAIRVAQRVRRARTEAIWQRQGYIPSNR